MVEKTVSKVTQDCVVSLDYVLTVDGEVADSSEGYAPLQFLQGHQNIIAGLEKELYGMQIGETKEIIVQPADAYGEYDKNAFIDIPKTQFPANFEFKLGKTIRLTDPNGRATNADIMEIRADEVRLDLNHPMAGKVLNFKVTVVGLRHATAEELSAGRLHRGSCGSCTGDGACGGEGGCG